MSCEGRRGMHGDLRIEKGNCRMWAELDLCLKQVSAEEVIKKKAEYNVLLILFLIFLFRKKRNSFLLHFAVMALHARQRMMEPKQRNMGSHSGYQASS